MIRYHGDVLRPLAGVAILAVTAHCGSRPAADLDSAPPGARREQPRRSLAGYEAHFLITWNGARIGDASESLRAHGDGSLSFERRERVTVRRGHALAHSETDLVIDTSAALEARRVAVRQIASGALHRGVAERNARGDWLVTYADEPARLIPGATVPAELVPLLLAAAPGHDRVRFDGPVMLPGYGFAVAHLHVEAEDERSLLATLTTPEGELRSRFVLAQSGTLTRIEGEDGIGAHRVDAAVAAAGFTPPEIVDAASVPIEPPPGLAGAEPDSLILGPIPGNRPLPPPLPGQHIDARAGAWHVRLSAGDHFAPPVSSAAYPAVAPLAAPDAELARVAARIIAQSNPGASARDQAFALARATAGLLADDLGAPEGNARAALMLGRGDCTAHALLFAALARARGIPTRLVTGFRVNDGRLVRHRWAIVAVEGIWLAVDPTHGEAPAAARLVGLAIHGTRTAELALADDVAFAGLGQVRAQACADTALSARPCAPSSLRTP